MNCYTTDLWQIGIVQAPIQHIVASGSLDGFRIKWITPDKSLTFLADPFGLWKKGVLYLFAESYDYRTRRGDIIAYKLNADTDVIEQRTVLQEPGIFLILLCLKPITKSGCYLKDINQVR